MLSEKYQKTYADYAYETIKRTREYQAGYTDGRAESAVDIADLQARLATAEKLNHWYESMTERIMSDDDPPPPTQMEIVDDWFNRNKPELTIVAGFFALLLVAGLAFGWIWLKGGI